jgi:hypothetical protein
VHAHCSVLVLVYTHRYCALSAVRKLCELSVKQLIPGAFALCCITQLEAMRHLLLRAVEEAVSLHTRSRRSKLLEKSLAAIVVLASNSMSMTQCASSTAHCSAPVLLA